MFVSNCFPKVVLFYILVSFLNLGIGLLISFFLMTVDVKLFVC